MLTKFRLRNALKLARLALRLSKRHIHGAGNSTITKNEQKSWCAPQKKLQRPSSRRERRVDDLMGTAGRVGFKACRVALKPGEATVVPRFLAAALIPRSLIWIE